ncbi:hypothetical protein LTR17_025023 [Elasticomyces elasticus]|nr:hypothetical protein LTR17_025023 [Elasticomyces elasticus]
MPTEEVLDEYGPMIVASRSGGKDFIVDNCSAHDSPTNTKDFKFEKAAFALIHSDFLALFDKDGRFVHDIDGLVESGVQLRMTSIIEEVFPVFDFTSIGGPAEFPTSSDTSPCACSMSYPRIVSAL